LSDYLDENLAGEDRTELEQHIAACPNCWVIADTTKKTIRVYKGMDPYPIPPDVEARLMQALERKMAAKQPK
jgi:anti-sigma factor RsiW